MDYTFSVRRRRVSVTQGEATVYLNGIALVTFGDTIELVNENRVCYGENIGGWASLKPDRDFIRGVLWHPYDNLYHYSNLVDDVLRTGAPRIPDYGKVMPLE